MDRAEEHLNKVIMLQTTTYLYRIVFLDDTRDYSLAMEPPTTYRTTQQGIQSSSSPFRVNKARREADSETDSVIRASQRMETGYRLGQTGVSKSVRSCELEAGRRSVNSTYWPIRCQKFSAYSNCRIHRAMGKLHSGSRRQSCSLTHHCILCIG